MAEHKSKLGVGLIIGTVVGAAAAFFLTPKSGKQNRDMFKKKWDELMTAVEDGNLEAKVREIYGDVSDETTKLYKELQKQSRARVKEMQTALNDVDVTQYTKLVNSVLDNVKKEVDANAERIEKSKQYLMSFMSDKQDEMADEQEDKPKKSAKSKK